MPFNSLNTGFYMILGITEEFQVFKKVEDMSGLRQRNMQFEHGMDWSYEFLLASCLVRTLHHGVKKQEWDHGIDMISRRKKN